MLKLSVKDQAELAEKIKESPVVLFEPTHKTNILKIRSAMQHYKVNESEKVFIPEIGKSTRRPVSFGSIYWMKTSHRAQKGYHARSTGPYEGASLQAVGGKAHEGGQRLGELDTACLAAYDLKNFVIEISSMGSDDLESKFKSIQTIYKKGTLSMDDIKDAKSTSAMQIRIILESMGVLEPMD